MPRYVPSWELEREAKKRIKEIVKRMNGLSEEELIDKYIHDVSFHNYFDVLVDLFIQAKFDV